MRDHEDLLLFEFECLECGHEWRSISRDPEHEPECPECGAVDADRDCLGAADASWELEDSDEGLLWGEIWDEDEEDL